MNLQQSRSRGLQVLLVGACIGAPHGRPAPALGALLAYEGFDYSTDASLASQSGGGSFGFSQPWTLGGLGLPQHVIGSSSLSHPVAALATSGNHAVVRNVSPSGFTTARRTLGQQLGAAGSQRYLSLLLRPEGQLGAGDSGGYFGLELVSSGTALFVGKPSINEYVLEDIGGTEQYSSGVAAITNEPVLLVLRADFETGNDSFRLYVNPLPGQSEPLVPDAMKAESDVGIVAQIGLFSTGTFSFDEIRIGESFADVTPVPEPGSLMLLCFALVGLLQVTRRSLQ